MKIFVSYAHDDVGKRLEQELVGKLREHGYLVASDRDMPEANPASMQEWMNERVAEGIVLCVLSPDYVARFATGSGSSERRGVRSSRWHYRTSRPKRRLQICASW